MKEISETKINYMAVAFIGLAFFFNGVWVNLVGYSPAFAIEEASNLARFSFLVGSAVSGLCIAIISQYRQINMKSAGPLFALLSLAGTALLITTPQQQGGITYFLLIASFMSVGIGNTWNTLAVFALLKKNGSLFSAVLCFCLSTTASTVIFQLSQSFMSSDAQVIIALLCCFCTSASLFGANRQLLTGAISVSNPNSNSEQAYKDGIQKFTLQSAVGKYRREFMYLVGAALSIVAVYGISDKGIWGGSHSAIFANPPALFLFTVSALLSLVVVIGLFYFFSKKSKFRKYQIPFLVLIAGFMLLVSFDLLSYESAAVIVFQTILDLYCHALFPIIVVYCTLKLPFSSFLVGGIFQVLNYSFGLLWVIFLDDSGLGGSIVILLIAYILMVTISIGSGERQNETTGHSKDASSESNPYDALLSQAEAIAKDHRLTSRETEILGYLLQGRSLPYIAEKLFISGGTVKTHMKHLYKKLGVHSKQELINMVKTEEDE